MAPDVPTTIFVLLHLAEKLEKVHARGLCHRDIKPANVLWRPSANAWTLMDFGCAAALGVILGKWHDLPCNKTCMSERPSTAPA
jgi:serine/threonine protein kinase